MSKDEQEILEKYREMIPENKAMLLSKAHALYDTQKKQPENPVDLLKCPQIIPFPKDNGQLANPHLGGNVTRNPGHCKLDFIWDHLP